MLNLKKIWCEIYIVLQYRLSLLLLASMEWNIQQNTMADPTLFRLSLHDLNTTQQSWNYIFRKKGYNNNHLSKLICTKTCSKSQLLSVLGLTIHQVQRKPLSPPLLILWAVIRYMKVIQHLSGIKHFNDNLIEITLIYQLIHC